MFLLPRRPARPRSVHQPRFYCRSCQRYWTAGGHLRNITPGSGKRKSRYSAAASTRDALVSILAGSHALVEGAGAGAIRLALQAGAQPRAAAPAPAGWQLSGPSPLVMAPGPMAHGGAAYGYLPPGGMGGGAHPGFMGYMPSQQPPPPSMMMAPGPGQAQGQAQGQGQHMQMMGG